MLQKPTFGRAWRVLATALLACALCAGGLCGCSDQDAPQDADQAWTSTASFQDQEAADSADESDAAGEAAGSEPTGAAGSAGSDQADSGEGGTATAATAAGAARAAAASSTSSQTFDLADVPAYEGEAAVMVNNNKPTFTKADLKAASGTERYARMDNLGRCGTALACVGRETMPTEERGSIGSVKPTGWHTAKYDCVDGRYLYNRCHLLGYQLTGENANERNLITGTRYLNVEGMLPYENEVADYVHSTGNHVLMRVTPVFKGKNLLASGVHMEAQSVEDHGRGIKFNVYCYNVQPGVHINYKDGSNWEEGALAQAHHSGSQASSHSAASSSAAASGSEISKTKRTGADYVLNVSSYKFHLPECSSVSNMSPHNRRYFHGKRSRALELGFDPCGNCNP